MPLKKLSLPRSLPPGQTQAIPDLDARVRNVKLLVEDLPSAHKPLLLAIADLLSFSSNANSHNSEKSRAAMVVRDAAEGLAPAILRAPPSTSQTAFGGDASVSPTASSWRPGWEDEMVATDVVELILSEQDRVLEGLRDERRLRWFGLRCVFILWLFYWFKIYIFLVWCILKKKKTEPLIRK